MERLDDILGCIKEMAPEELAEPWDNCGLLVAAEDEYIERAVVCLDVTPQSVETALKSDAKLIISHHPLIFNPIKKLNAGEPRGPGAADVDGVRRADGCRHLAARAEAGGSVRHVHGAVLGGRGAVAVHRRGEGVPDRVTFGVSTRIGL